MKILLSLLCCVGVFTLSAQSRYFKESASWLQKSEACKPVLTYTEHKPVKRVTSIKKMRQPTKVGACGTKEARICYSMSP